MKEPEWHPNSRVMPVLWRLIEKNDGCAVADLIRWTGYRRQIIDKSLRRMLADGRIHVSGFQRYEDTGSGMARQFSVGPGAPRRRPRIPKHQQYEAHKVKSKYRQRRVRIAEQTAANGVFGSMVAQLKYAS